MTRKKIAIQGAIGGSKELKIALKEQFLAVAGRIFENGHKKLVRTLDFLPCCRGRMELFELLSSTAAVELMILLFDV